MGILGIGDGIYVIRTGFLDRTIMEFVEAIDVKIDAQLVRVSAHFRFGARSDSIRCRFGKSLPRLYFGL